MTPSPNSGHDGYPYEKPPLAVEAALRERGIGWTNGERGGTFTAETCPAGCGAEMGMQWLGEGKFVFTCRDGDSHEVVRAALGIDPNADDGRYLPAESGPAEVSSAKPLRGDT